jgi:paraquat-inducible protein A
LFQRLPQSLSRTWALLITAAILLIPANLYPIMTVVYFGSGQPDTIISGVVRLIQSGQYPIAILVFIASVAVPVIKILGIAFLLLVVQLRWRLSPHQCTLMYRSIEWIGRWSLLDLFMISILVTLVDLGEIATVSAGTGSTAFAGVVVLTMMSVMTFDPRLIWDLQDTKDEHDSN